MLLVFIFYYDYYYVYSECQWACSLAKVFYYEFIRFDHFVRFVFVSDVRAGRSLPISFHAVHTHTAAGSWRTVIFISSQSNMSKIQYLFRSI